jgi:hypothetical protein
MGKQGFCFRNVCKILVGKAEGKRPLGRLTSRWDNTKTDLRETVWGGMDWIHLVQDRDQWTTPVNTAMHTEVPKNFGIFLSSEGTHSV